MIDRNKELAVNTAILGMGQLIPKFLGLILLPLITTYLSTKEYGDYDLIVSFSSLLIPIVTLQIQQAIFRYLLLVTEKKEKIKYITGATLYILISSTIVYPMIFIILKKTNLSLLTCALICVMFWSQTMYTLLGQIVRGLGFNAKYSVSVIVYSFMNLSFTVIMLAWLNLGLRGVIFSLILGCFSANVYMVIASGMLKYIKISSFSKVHLRQMLTFSIPIVPSSIALWVVNVSDRLIIIQFLGSAANGIYAVANKIPSLYGTAYNIFNLAWTETASRVSDDGDPSLYYTKLFHDLYAFLIGVMLVLIAITPVIFKFLIKGNYSDAIYQVPILYFGIFFNSIVNFYSGIYIALKRTKQVGFSSLAGAVLNVIINVLFVKKIGLYAASFSTALSFLVIAVYRAYDLNKVIKIEYRFNDIAFGLFCFIIADICLFIKNIPMLLICCLITVIYNLMKNKKIIIAILKRLL